MPKLAVGSTASTATGSSQLPKIIATSQQSRFHTETLDGAIGEVDLKDVNISIGDKELVVDSRLKLKGGVRYALVGRNGTGKSTLLQAIADKLIPGLSKSLRVLLVSQVEDTARFQADSDADKDISVLQHVVRGDKERMKAMQEFEALTRAVDAPKPTVTQRIINEIRLARLRVDLEDAQKVALRTSGARGKKAREEEIKAEVRVKEAEEALAEGKADLDIAGQAAEMLADVTTTLELLDASTTEARAAVILTGLGFTQAMVESPFTSLSGGWRSRCALATSLLVQSDVLMLDEPSNFLDLEATLWLEQHLTSSQDRTLMLTSHDQVFLNNVVEETILLREKTLRYFEGTPRAYEIDEKKKRKAAIRAQSALDKKKEHIENSIKQSIASGKQTGDDNRLRMAKSRQKKLNERWGAETSAKGTRFKLNRDMAGYFLTNRAEIAIESGESKVKITLPNPEKLRTVGDLVHFDAVGFRYPRTNVKGTSGKWMLENVTFTVPQGGRCVFIGANGYGKSTIAKLVLGELQPSKGTITRHPLLKIGYFSQHSVEELTASENSGGAPMTALRYFLEHFENKGDKIVESEARACLGTFGLGGKIASETPLKMLSGGQKVRLAFALIIYRPPSLLLLDEITTHVDAPTIQALARALRKFTGGLILVTHDRWFSRVVIEGHSLSSAGAFGDENDNDDENGSDVGSSSDVSSIDEDADAADADVDLHSRNRGRASKRVGETYYVGGGTIKKMDGGMVQYVNLVVRRLEKRRIAAEKAAAAAKKGG